MDISQLADIAKEDNLGATAGAGALNLVFGKGEQLDANKYTIASNQSEQNNKTMMIGLSFILVVVLLSLGGIYYATKSK